MVGVLWGRGVARNVAIVARVLKPLRRVRWVGQKSVQREAFLTRARTRGMYFGVGSVHGASVLTTTGAYSSRSSSTADISSFLLCTPSLR